MSLLVCQHRTHTLAASACRSVIEAMAWKQQRALKAKTKAAHVAAAQAAEEEDDGLVPGRCDLCGKDIEEGDVSVAASCAALPTASTC